MQFSTGEWLTPYVSNCNHMYHRVVYIHTMQFILTFTMCVDFQDVSQNNNPHQLGFQLSMILCISFCSINLQWGDSAASSTNMGRLAKSYVHSIVIWSSCIQGGISTWATTWVVATWRPQSMQSGRRQTSICCRVAPFRMIRWHWPTHSSEKLAHSSSV